MRSKILFMVFLAACAVFFCDKANACTGIMLRNSNDTVIVHGRTVEFTIPESPVIEYIPRNYKFTGKTNLGDGLTYKTKYAILGTSADVADSNVVDGINEAGLSVAFFYFPTFAEYTTVTEENRNRALSPCDFPNWLLSRFETVNEVRKAIENDSVAVVSTILDGWPINPPPFHYIVYDKNGSCIVIEPLKGKLVVYDDTLGVITNSPEFDWHMTNLRNYISLSPENVDSVNIFGNEISNIALGAGNGLFGLPGDFTPPSRFVRAAVFSVTSVRPKNETDGIKKIFHILNNFDIPKGSVVESGQYDYTLLTVARDPKNLSYYYKTYEDQAIRVVNMKHFDPNGTKMLMLSTESKQDFTDMSEKLK